VQLLTHRVPVTVQVLGVQVQVPVPTLCKVPQVSMLYLLLYLHNIDGVGQL